MSEVKLNKKIEALAEELAKEIRSEKDLSKLSQQLLKQTIEKALSVEMDEHLGYEKHAWEGRGSGNNRNGHSQKTIKTESGEVLIETPRDRQGSFEPQLVSKNQTRFTELDHRILTLYAKGMTTRDISETLKEMYGVNVSHTLISKVTDAVMDQVETWQNRPLESVYPIVFMDCIVVKVRENKRIINKSIYLALGINMEGHKELLGMWLNATEGSKFWLSILTELNNRGLKDIFIACVDGLTGFPEAINTAYPKTKIQLCIVHMVRNSLKYVSWKDRKEVAKDLKIIYHSVSTEQALTCLQAFAQKWDQKYPMISKSWHKHWENLITLFDYPEEIRKAIYTTNAIESLNSVIRKAIKNRRIFPKDESALKVVYLAVEQASKKWTMPIRNWSGALNRFAIEFEDRILAVR